MSDLHTADQAFTALTRVNLKVNELARGVADLVAAGFPVPPAVRSEYSAARAELVAAEDTYLAAADALTAVA